MEAKNSKRLAKIFSLVKSTALFGLVMAVSVNLTLSVLQPSSKVDPKKLPSEHTWIWWRTQEFLAQKSPPPVVLLGSSLMMIPVAMQDAEFLNKPLDASKHWQSDYMQARLSEQLSNLPEANSPACFNFAMPGAAISDDYMIVRTLLQGAHKPKVIVLGITLRDFVDSHLSCAAATDVFKYLSRFQPVDDLVALSMPQIWQRMDYALDKGFWLVGSRLDLQVKLAELVKDQIKPAGLNLIPHDESTNTTNIANNLKAVVEPGMFILKPGDSTTYEDNTQEYRARFKAVSAAIFANQEKFLQRLCLLANSQGVPVILTNMPLTQENMSLMPSGSYDSYLATVKDVSARYHLTFVNLNDGHTFVKSDFKDTAHMNAHGGQKLIDILTQKIAVNQDLVQALAKPKSPTALAAGKDRSL
jgi:hypothetical protein